MTSARQRRLDTKYKGQLICEACNRWTRVPMETWKDAIKRLRDRHQTYTCLCKRPACIKSRPEGLLSVYSDRDKERIIYGITQKNSHQSTQHSLELEEWFSSSRGDRKDFQRKPRRKPSRNPR